MGAVTPGETLGTLYNIRVTCLLTTSPSPAPFISVRWPDSNAQAAASGVP